MPNTNKYSRNIKVLPSTDLALFKICKENKGFAPPKAPKMSSDPLPKFFDILACSDFVAGSPPARPPARPARSSTPAAALLGGVGRFGELLPILQICKENEAHLPPRTRSIANNRYLCKVCIKIIVAFIRSALK